MQPKLKKLVDKGLLWQGKVASGQQKDYLNTGSAQLDELLGGGWQLAGLHEIQRYEPFTEQCLLTSLLRQALSRQIPVFWIAPPALVSASGLAWQLSQQSLQVVINVRANEAAWAFEQVLQSGAGIAFVWQSQSEIDAGMVRRWYKAAQAGKQTGFVFTDIAHQPEAKAYTNRVQLQHTANRVDVVKRRYGWPVTNIDL